MLNPSFLPSFASGLSFLLSFTSPFIVLNYFFIFHRGKYEKILKKYPDTPKMIALKYVYISAGLAWASAMFYGLIN
jgi:hypothetical protein